MRSMIDEITKAEQQAEEICQAALVQAREESLAFKAQAEKALAELDKSEREDTLKALAEAEPRGEMLADKIRAEMAADADADCQKAEAQMQATLDYLMKKVLDFA